MSAGLQIFLLAVVAVALIALGLWIALHLRMNPEKRERKRREWLHERGRLGEAWITGVEGNLIFYTYSLRGVQYEASQDISTLHGRLPEDRERLIGTSGMKYAVNNPGNSILVCEQWCGFAPPSPVKKA